MSHAGVILGISDLEIEKVDRDQGIKVSCLCPQGVRTDLLAQAMGHTAVEAVVAQGLIEPEDVAAATIAGLRSEQFLILPHPEVADYYKYRAADTDGWLSRMRAILDQWKDRVAS